jgi:hypothetical protein
MKVTYYTKPLPQYVSTKLEQGMKNHRTTYTCPLCKIPYSKREFESHVFKTHANRIDEAFAMLFGIPYPSRCSCGKELHYSQSNRGFPKTCGNCTMGSVDAPQYKNADDAHKHVEQLQAMLANARAEETRLKKEAELSRIHIEQLNFPSSRYNAFLRRLTMNIRTYAVNWEPEKLKELANFIDSKITDKN